MSEADTFAAMIHALVSSTLKSVAGSAEVYRFVVTAPEEQGFAVERFIDSVRDLLMEQCVRRYRRGETGTRPAQLGRGHRGHGPRRRGRPGSRRGTPGTPDRHTIRRIITTWAVEALAPWPARPRPSPPRRRLPDKPVPPGRPRRPRHPWVVVGPPGRGTIPTPTAGSRTCPRTGLPPPRRSTPRSSARSSWAAGPRRAWPPASARMPLPLQSDQSVEDQRNHTYEQLKLLANTCGAPVPGHPRERGRAMTRRQPLRVRGAGPRGPLAAGSSPACSGVFRLRRAEPGRGRHHGSGCRPSWTSACRCVRHDGDRARLDVASIGTATYIRRRTGCGDPHPLQGGVEGCLGNAAVHGRAATVLAQLIVNGTNHGVHCLYVPLRGTGQPCRAWAARTTAARAGSTASTTATALRPRARAPHLLNKYGGMDDGITPPRSLAGPPLLHDHGRPWSGPRVPGRCGDGRPTSRPEHRRALRGAAPPVAADSGIEEQTLLDSAASAG
ncbi:hypothetical protein QJS66_07400 [Kocuria rhizophila]|nr:hypothetical protein QJS66_07400 [Kocuria rhizophila]